MQQQQQQQSNIIQQQMAAQQQQMANQMAIQQQQMLDAQKQILEQQQQQKQIMNSSQNEGMNPYYGNIQNQNVNNVQAPSYPVLNTQNVQVSEEKEPEIVPVMGQDAANEVFQWLSKLKTERYYKTFIENGYDQLTAIGDIEREDLKEMGVALGHIRIIVAAAVTAPDMNKRVKLKSVGMDTFIQEKTVKKMNDNGMRCILQHSEKENKAGAVWLFEMLDDDTNSYFRLKHVPTGTFLRMLGTGSADTRSPWSIAEKNGDGRLMLEKKGKGVYFIKVQEEMYLRFDEKRALGYNKVECTDKPDKNCRIELKLV